MHTAPPAAALVRAPRQSGGGSVSGRAASGAAAANAAASSILQVVSAGATGRGWVQSRPVGWKQLGACNRLLAEGISASRQRGIASFAFSRESDALREVWQASSSAAAVSPQRGKSIKRRPRRLAGQGRDSQHAIERAAAAGSAIARSVARFLAGPHSLRVRHAGDGDRSRSRPARLRARGRGRAALKAVPAADIYGPSLSGCLASEG
jgi:hypothetical protein